METTEESYYRKRKTELLEDNKDISSQNKKLFREFLEWEEIKLKRTNRIPKLDESCYKTLNGYLTKLKNVNKWFKDIGKPALQNITQIDIQKVYDGLEEGKIKNNKGTEIIDKASYYNKIFRSKLFEMIGKEKEAEKVLEFYKKDNQDKVKFIDEASFLKIVNNAISKKHKLLLWLLWDYGENVFSVLQLRKNDFTKQINEETKEEEYRLDFHKEILKRSRTARGEINLYHQTTEFLNEILPSLKDNNNLFDFGLRQAEKMFDRAVKIAGVVTLGNGKNKGKKATLKDLRSGMACHLLSIGWHIDEINARLGHKPSSQEINKYVVFLAINKRRDDSKKRIFDGNVQKLNQELQESKLREKGIKEELQSMREEQEKKLEQVTEMMEAMKKIQKHLQAKKI